MSKSFNPKFIQAKLRLGWTTKDFTEYYNVSKEEMYEFIDSHSTNPVYSSFRRTVSENERNARHKNKKNTHSTNEKKPNSETMDTSTIPSVRVVDPITQKIEDFDKEIKEQEAAREKKISSRDDLQKKVESSKKNIELQREQINAANAELGKAKLNYETIKKQCESRVQSMMATIEEEQEKIAENTVIITQMNDTLNRINEYIAECEQEIRNLKKITITVTKDQQIYFNKPFPYDDDISFFADKLEREPLAERMMVYQVKLCARLLTILKALREKEEIYEFVFAPDDNKENENLKTLFELTSEAYFK